MENVTSLLTLDLIARQDLGLLVVANEGLAEARNTGSRHGGGNNTGHDTVVLELPVDITALLASVGGEGAG